MMMFMISNLANQRVARRGQLLVERRRSLSLSSSLLLPSSSNLLSRLQPLLPAARDADLRRARLLLLLSRGCRLQTLRSHWFSIFLLSADWSTR